MHTAEKPRSRAPQLFSAPSLKERRIWLRHSLQSETSSLIHLALSLPHPVHARGGPSVTRRAPALEAAADPRSRRWPRTRAGRLTERSPHTARDPSAPRPPRHVRTLHSVRLEPPCAHDRALTLRFDPPIGRPGDPLTFSVSLLPHRSRCSPPEPTGSNETSVNSSLTPGR